MILGNKFRDNIVFCLSFSMVKYLKEAYFTSYNR